MPLLENVVIKGDRNGIIIYPISTSYLVADSFFQSVRIGILIQDVKGILTNNVFKSIYYKNTVQSSSYPGSQWK
jgi:hypothetical protein